MRLPRKQFEPTNLTKTADVLSTRKEDKQPKPFNPETDISDTELRLIIGVMNQYERDEIWDHYIDFARRLVFLYPDRRADLGIDDNYEKAKRLLVSYQNRGDWWNFAGLAENMVFLFPDRRADFDYKRHFDEMLEHLKTYFGVEAADYCEMARRLLFLFPDRKTDLDYEKNFDALKDELDDSRDFPATFGEMAANMALLFPNRRDDLEIDKSLPKFRSYFEGSRNAPGWISKDACHLIVLEAEQAEITPNGKIKITKLPPAMESKPELPIRNQV